MRATHKLYVSLACVFVACLLLGDVITAEKTISTPLGPISVGIIPFPVTFLLTDVVNDFYGRKGAAFLTLLGFSMARPRVRDLASGRRGCTPTRRPITRKQSSRRSSAEASCSSSSLR